ncbi:MAG TPA: hypothetical protein VIB80_06040 [Aquiluna sp.]
MRRLIWLAFTISGLLFLSAFTPTVLVPPSEIQESRTVFVIDHGTHSSVAIETDSGQMMRYAYGDFRYYANRDTSLGAGAAALLWPTPSTLGRALLEGPATKESLLRQLRVVVEIVYELQVEGDSADQLILELDEIHARKPAEHVDVPAYGLVFSPHPVDYFWGHNSSSVIAGWLREMGVGMFGWGLIASWRVVGA